MVTPDEPEIRVHDHYVGLEPGDEDDGEGCANEACHRREWCDCAE